MKDARRKQIQEAAIKYSDQFLDGYRGLARASFIFAAEWADSHPDTTESYEGPYRYSHPKLKAAFDEGCAHARKSQANEVVKMRELLENAHDLLKYGASRSINGPWQWLKDYAELKKELV